MTLQNRVIWALAVMLTVCWCQGALADIAAGGKDGGESKEQVAESQKDRLVSPPTVVTSESDGRRLDDSSPKSVWWQLAQTGLALLIVVVLIFALRFVLGRLGGRAVRKSGGNLEVLTRMSVSHRQELLVVRLGKRVVLVGSSSTGNMQTLSEITDEQEVANIVGPAGKIDENITPGDKE